MLQQMQLLRPGAYELVGHSIGLEQPDSVSPYWVLSCRTDGRELGRVRVPRSREARGQFRGEFKVPENCPVQILMLVARPGAATSGTSGQIDYVQLRPVR